MLQLFKTVPIVSELFRAGACPERATAYARDTVTLGWEDRLKARARRRSDGGSEFATVLARGTALRGGDALVVDELALVVVVVEAAEAVFVVRPANAEEWGRFGYQIGNSHQPLMIAGDVIVCADLPGMAQVLEQNGIPFERDVRPFTPLQASSDHRHEG